MESFEHSVAIDQLLGNKVPFWRKVAASRPFTEQEAWQLFRLAALAEAFGWTTLIGGIIIARYHLPGQRFAVLIAGQIHGTIFMAYFGVLIAVYTSLGWSRVKALCAVVAGVPPYGTLLFELWAARQQRKTVQQSYRRIAVRAVIHHKQTTLAMQPNNSLDWILPGDYVMLDETPEQALQRSLKQLTGVDAKIGALQHVIQAQHKNEQCLEFYFIVANVADFLHLDFAHIVKTNPSVDEMSFVPTTDVTNL